MGVGLTIPSLIGAGTASIPPARFGTGSGVLNMSRQIGTVLGVAGLIAILAGLHVADPIVAFARTELVIVFFALAGITSATLLSRRVTTSDTRRDALRGVELSQIIARRSAMVCLG